MADWHLGASSQMLKSSGVPGCRALQPHWAQSTACKAANKLFCSFDTPASRASMTTPMHVHVRVYRHMSRICSCVAYVRASKRASETAREARWDLTDLTGCWHDHPVSRAPAERHPRKSTCIRRKESLNTEDGQNEILEEACKTGWV